MRFGLIILIAFGLTSVAHAEPAVPGASGVTGDAAARLLAAQTVLQATGGSDNSPLAAGGLPAGPQTRASAAPTVRFPTPVHGAVTPPQRFLPLHPQARAFPVPMRSATAVTAEAVRAMATGSTSAQGLGRAALAAATAPPPAAAALAQIQNYTPHNIKRIGGSAESYQASARANAAVVDAMHQYRLTHGMLDLPTPH